MNVPATAMRVFTKALNPNFVWEDLAKNYKSTILGLLKDRSNGIESRPTKRLLGLVSDETKLQVDGGKGVHVVGEEVDLYLLNQV